MRQIVDKRLTREHVETVCRQPSCCRHLNGFKPSIAYCNLSTLIGKILGQLPSNQPVNCEGRRGTVYIPPKT